VTYPKPASLPPPPAKAGDIVYIHVPDIGVWVIEQVVRDYRGTYFYRLSRRRNGRDENEIVSVHGVEILRPTDD
jgi:hypothetical protein